MRPIGRYSLGLALASALALIATADARSATDEVKLEFFGKGPAYKTLASLAVMHSGRVKPIDTLAREEIKQIYGRETIKLQDADGQFVASWEPVAALLDWAARPDYWNEQPFIKVEYLPLKWALLRTSTKSTLSEVAAKSTTSAADKAAIEAVIALDEIGTAQVEPLLGLKGLPKEDLLTLARLHGRLGEGQKWLAPHDLEDAQVVVDGRPVTFAEWIDSISERNREASRTVEGKAKLSELERRGYEVGTALGQYRALRDRDMSGFLPVLIMPRPYTSAYLTFVGEALNKAQESKGQGLSPLELESAITLNKYLEDLPRKDWAAPGSNPEFDVRFTAWLKDKSAWLPLKVLRDTPAADLARAGYPVAEVEAFRAAFGAMEEAERISPGKIDESPANALLAAARTLGQALNAKTYPDDKSLSREVAFNTFGPFFWAPVAYGVGTVLLLLSLSVQGSRSGVVKSIHRGLYAGGMAGFIGGIGLEVYGFSQRVLITGWAPVTNMYETVIWVAMVTSVIGLVMEAIFRRTYAALAASGVALVATALAATVPLLDPSIKQLQPVLRSNLWLAIHVLTIVSSYAAFALAMGLGLIATGYYLTATYRRSASLAELSAPLLPGLPLLGIGMVLRQASFGPISIASKTIDLGTWTVNYAFWPSVIIASIGGVLTLMTLVALVGEILNRTLHRPGVASGLSDAPGRDWTKSDDRALVGAGSGGLPPISGGGPVEETDPRSLAMRETATKIKPLSNFIYRSMQVGVLLVAAGTILGGIWADYSWGRFWGWDPKEVWALITLLVYLIPLHGRFAGWVNTFGLVFASVVCFLSVLMAWYGVNFLLGVGLHAYGFVEGGSQGIVGLVTLAILAIPAGAAWRRHLSQKFVPVSVA